MKKVLRTILVLITSFAILLVFDPAFTRTIQFEEFTVDYKWRIFNDEYDNWKTSGHGHPNYLNKKNAERELLLKLAENYNGKNSIKHKLESTVQSRYDLHMHYTAIVEDGQIDVDSIVKYRDILFEKIPIL